MARLVNSQAGLQRVHVLRGASELRFIVARCGLEAVQLSLLLGAGSLRALQFGHACQQLIVRLRQITGIRSRLGIGARISGRRGVGFLNAETFQSTIQANHLCLGRCPLFIC